MCAGVVASRDQLCVQESLISLSNTEKTQACNALNKKEDSEKCCFRVNLELKETPTDSILDIEDLDRIGRAEEMCPYYLSKYIRKNADIVFMPYNYILDPMVRGNMDIKLQNAIIILDEGHNVEKMCEDSACTKIDSSKISIAVRDLNYVNFFYNSNILV